MRKNYHIIKVSRLFCLVIFTFIFALPSVKAEDLRKVVQLSGYWKFTIGDNEGWANPAFNDSDWDEIRVPSKWEDQGYSEYNGYAWYRKKFKMYEVAHESPIYLVLGKIDDTDEVYLNGKLIATSGSFPINYVSAHDKRRKYLIPREYLKFNETNFLAVRVYDSYGGGGIVSGPVGIFSDEDYSLLDFNLSGKWKFHLGDNKQWKSTNYNDEIWKTINVPSGWEEQGYQNYDGYAWYRKEFVVPNNLRNETLYLSLGKIDDYDYVYLNGKLIGNVFDLEKDREYRMKGYEYNARRIYRIPEDILNKSGKNVIAIRVFDGKHRGGIYEGPIGLMTEGNMRTYKRSHYSSQSFWDYVIDQFMDD